MDLEYLRDQVTITLCRLSKDRLMEVCNLLKYIADEEAEELLMKANRRELMKVIEHKLDNVEKS